MPSPTSDWRRWTRKKPTAGARTPTTAPAPKARRMNSLWNMDVSGVVPEPGKLVGRAVEDDRPTDEDEALDVVLDGSELVRHVDDRHSELAVQVGEETCDRLLGLRVNSGRRLVENEERRLRCERLRDERPLLHAAREGAER